MLIRISTATSLAIVLVTAFPLPALCSAAAAADATTTSAATTSATSAATTTAATSATTPAATTTTAAEPTQTSTTTTTAPPSPPASSHAPLPAATPPTRAAPIRSAAAHRWPWRHSKRSGVRDLVLQIHHGGQLAHAAGDPGDTISDFKFSPSTITIHAGDTITWTNNGPAPHTATAKDHSFDTGTLQRAQSASHTFTTAGTFAYICTIHPFMHGTVVVLAAGSTTPAQSGGGGSPAQSGGGGAGSGPSAGSGSPASSAPPGTGVSSATQAAATPARPSLPTTGLNLAAMLLVGGGLLGAGTALQRRSRA